MTGAQGPTLRSPAVAGTFYPGDAERCRRAAEGLLREQTAAATHEGRTLHGTQWLGAIVPHAGWICSGAIAAQSIAALAQRRDVAPDVVVVFGAVHTPGRFDFAALDAHDRWAVPGGETPLALDAMRELTTGSAGGGLFDVEERLHRHEHAIEVELPLIQQAWPNAMLLPIEVPANEAAVEIGRRVAEVIGSNIGGSRAVYLASSDLTHYGPSYGFTPGGVGPDGLAWAKRNDVQLLERVTDLAAERIVPEAREHLNACGAGAIAAMLSACVATGATAARVLRHANSYETLAAVAPQPAVDAVGYAAVVVG
jgi:AmmeMemoRadiSam system protein B